MSQVNAMSLSSAGIPDDLLKAANCEIALFKHKIRQQISAHARLSLDVGQLSDSADLYDAGMTSLATVTLMLALENEFGVEFPDNMLSRSLFESVDSIAAAIASLQSTESL
jgi:acyl carrier protein